MRRACAYALERSFGRVVKRRDGETETRVRFEEDDDVGAATLRDVEFDAEAVSAYAGRALGRCGARLVSMRCGKITGRIPWEAIGRDSCWLEVEDVAVVARFDGAGGDDEDEDEDEDEEERESESSRVMRRVVREMMRGLRGRAREVTVGVQDASGAGKFFLRAASVE